MRTCKVCSEEICETVHDVNLCAGCWDKAFEHMAEYQYPCSDHDCVFTHPGGMGTNGGCSCLEDFPMSKVLRRHLRHEIRMGNARAIKKGHKQAMIWLERAIKDKVWESGDGIKAGIEDGLKYVLARMKMEL